MGARMSLFTDEDNQIKITSDAVNMTKTIIETTDYNKLENKPSIEGNELIGNKTLDELGINKDSLDITAETLGITPESMGMDTSDEYSIYSLFHS